MWYNNNTKREKEVETNVQIKVCKNRRWMGRL